MKTIFSFLIVLFFSITAYSSSIQIRPTSNNWTYWQGYLSDLSIDITTTGNYAKIDLTFKVNVDSLHSSSSYYQYYPSYRDQMLEAILYFDMPKESFFNDSYLWLNDQVIIRADLIGAGKATQIYNGIVKRKQDPSLFKKISTESYMLQIFPIATNFARKVKLSYMIPLQHGPNHKAFIPMPNSIINLIKNNSAISFTFNGQNKYTFSNTVFPIKSGPVTTSGNLQSFTILVEEFKKNTNSYLELNEESPTLIKFYYKPISENEGYYEIKIKTDLLPNAPKNTNLYSIKLPFITSGFTLNNMNNSNSRLMSSQHYSEVGIYYGKLDLSLPIKFDFANKDSFYSISVFADTMNICKEVNQIWAKYYFDQVLDQTDMVKISLENRVLNNYTAFLALETGDTVKEATSNNNYKPGSISEIQTTETTTMKVFPNPFIDLIKIQAQEEIVMVQITDINGQIKYSSTDSNLGTSFEISTANLDLTEGLYFVIIQTNKGKQIFKLLKQAQ